MNELAGAEKQREEDFNAQDMSGVYVPELLAVSRTARESETGVPLWLVTFTDVIALMLTFFVLLYSMSVPEEDKWEDITAALSSEFKDLYSKPYNTGPSDAIQIDKIASTRALDLSYLKGLLDEVLEKDDYAGVLIVQSGDNLLVSLPDSLLFESGKTEIRADGKKALFRIGGVLNRIRNRVEVAGYTGPDPVPENPDLPYASNWDLSLMRAGAVSAFLREAGYTRPLTVTGFSSGRYDALPGTMDQDRRLDLSRRVDLVITGDDGGKRMLLEFQ